MHEKNSSGWYQDLVDRLSQGALTVARVAVFAPHEVTILVEQHDPETIASTESSLAAVVEDGTRARIVSLQTYEQDARVIRDAVAASSSG